MTTSESNRRTIAALISLGLVLLFQIGLCLALFCSGISIVWCACFGWFLKKSSLKSTGFANDTTAAEDPLSNHSSTVTPQQQEQHDVLYEEYTSPPNNMERAPNQLLCGDICMGLLNVGLICYYALTAESITTIAHLCAVLLGMLLALLEDYVTCPCCVSCCCPFLEIPIAGITRENGTVNISSSDDPLLSSTEAVPAYGRPDLTSTGDVFAPPTESLGMNRPAVRGSFNTSWLKNSFFRSANFQDDFDLSTGVDEERK